MARTFSAAVSAAILSDSFQLPAIVLIELASGDTISLTEWDEELTVNLDGNGNRNYEPNKFEGISTFSAQINAPIDDSELILLIDHDVFTADDVRRGRYDNANVTIGYVVPGSPNEPVLHRRYDVGQTQINGLRITLELMGPEKRLEQPTGRTLTANCPFTFGDNDCGIPSRANVWDDSTAFAQHVLVKPTVADVLWYEAIIGGTSGATEPVWPLSPSGTVVDGTITWQTRAARRVIGTVASVVSRRVFGASGITIFNDYFGEGYLTWLTGDNIGDRRRVKTDNGTGTLTLHLGAYDDIQVGDTFEVVVGCRKRLTEDCIGKHNNALYSRTRTLRYGGFPHLAPENVTATAPKGGEDEDE